MKNIKNNNIFFQENNKNILTPQIRKVDSKSTIGGIIPLFNKELATILDKNRHMRSSKIITMFFMCFLINLYFYHFLI